MKKEKIVIGLMTILALCGCRDVNVDVDVCTVESSPFVATIDEDFGTETKTSLNNGKVLWKRGDQISIFAGSTVNGQYQVSDDSDGKTSAKLNKLAGNEFSTGGEIENNVAFYPYTPGASIINLSANDYFINDLKVPSTQHYAEDSFGNGSFPMVAITESSSDMNLKFKNIFGGIKIQLKGSACIKSVAIKGIGIVRSEMDLLIQPSETVVISKGQDLNSVTLDCGTGVQLNEETPTAFVIALPPCEYHYGFSVVVTDTDNKQMLIETTKKQVIKRSTILKMPPVIFKGEVDCSMAIMSRFHPVPNDMQYKIKHIHVNTNSEVTTDERIYYYEDERLEGFDFPNIYFEIDGDSLNLYTKSPKIKVISARQMFSDFPNLESVDLSKFDFSECEDFGDMFSGCRHLKSIDASSFDTSHATNMNGMFTGCASLTQLDLSKFDTHNVVDMSFMFNHCHKLKKLYISGFTASQLASIEAMFRSCYSLTGIDMASFDMSTATVGNTFEACRDLAKNSKICAIRCPSATRNILENQCSLSFNNCIDYIEFVEPGADMPNYSARRDPNLYYSEDFSKDKTVKVLQTSTCGSGLNIVLMGDAYSDRMIDDGTYDSDIMMAVEAIFSEEPYKSYRNLFNIYQVYAVSENEVPGENTVFECYQVDNSVEIFSRNEGQIKDYITSVDGINSEYNVPTLIVINGSGRSGAAGGYSYGYNGYEYIVSNQFDYCGVFKQNQGLPWSEAEFKRVVSHEFGHCFGKLADEYESLDDLQDFERDHIRTRHKMNMDMNIDLTNDPSTIIWSHFLSDIRYQDTVGIYQGGYNCCAEDVWRPSENSIMRYNTGGFNAPSREAIYKRIHKLAYGDSWQYDYETFVQQDLKNLPSKTNLSDNQMRSITPNLPRGKHISRITKTESADGKITVKYFRE